MGNYTKNSVKLLQKIENHNNNTYFYTEFDGNYSVGDILYISTKNNSGGVQNIVDSFYAQTGYRLISKKGNRLELEISYNHLKENGITTMPPYGNSDSNEAYIGRVYVNNATMKRGNINNSMLHNVSIEPNVKGDVNLIQSVLVSIKEKNSERKIKNIDFNNKYDDDTQILKSENTSQNTINSFYTDNNNGFGISYINLSDDVVELENCNISSGIFRDCILNGDENTITNGYLEDCNIDNYIIDNGYFNNCILNLNNVWNYGFWLNSGDTGAEFQVLDWNDGVWVDGYFPTLTTWHNGIFMDGKFQGDSWENGEFQSGTFSTSTWNNGVFNSGLFEDSTWINGEFYDGQMVDSIWNNGIFHNGTMYSSDELQKVTWNNGIVNDGSFLYVQWNNGTVNYGDFFQCNWVNGVFNNGQMLECEWTDGEFYDGIIQGKSETLPKDTETVTTFGVEQMSHQYLAINTPYKFECDVDEGQAEMYFRDQATSRVEANEDTFYWNRGAGDNELQFNTLPMDDRRIGTCAIRGVRYVIELTDAKLFDPAESKDIAIYFTLTTLDGNTTYDNNWENGKFFNGTMLDMSWSKGVVYNGIFYGVQWQQGTWYNGTSVDSKFNKVDWYNGIFNSTSTTYYIVANDRDSEKPNPADDFDIINADGIINGGTWYNGVFNNGLFGIDTNPNIDAVWEKGNFYNGIYNGDVWKGGLFYNGIVSIKKFIPERYKVNKDYKPYNMDKIKKRRFKLKRRLKLNFRRKVSKYITPRTRPSARASLSS